MKNDNYRCVKKSHLVEICTYFHLQEGDMVSDFLVHNAQLSHRYPKTVLNPGNRGNQSSIVCPLQMQMDGSLDRDHLLKYKRSEETFFLVLKDSGVSLKGQISYLPEPPYWLYVLIALQQHSPLPRKYHQTEN